MKNFTNKLGFKNTNSSFAIILNPEKFDRNPYLKKVVVSIERKTLLKND